MREAWATIKALPPVLSFEPLVTSGPDAFQEGLQSRSEAYDQLMKMADAMRTRVPELTTAQAFERVLHDPVNAELTRRALNPVQPMTSYPFPDYRSSPPRP